MLPETPGALFNFNNMIIRNGKEYKPSKEQMKLVKDKFPAFFKDKDPSEVVVKYPDSRKLTTINDDGKVVKVKTPEGTLLSKSVVQEKDDDGIPETVEYIWCRSIKSKNKDGKLEVEPRNIPQMDGMRISPLTDTDLLVFLYLWSPQVIGNKCPNPSPLQRVYLDDERSEALREINKEKQTSRCVTMISDEEYGLDDAEILNIAMAMGIEASDAVVARGKLLRGVKHETAGEKYRERFLSYAEGGEEIMRVRKLIRDAVSKGGLNYNASDFAYEIKQGDEWVDLVTVGAKNHKDPTSYLANWLTKNAKDLKRVEAVCNEKADNMSLDPMEKTILDYNVKQPHYVRKYLKGRTEDDVKAFFKPATEEWQLKLKKEFIEE